MTGITCPRCKQDDHRVVDTSRKENTICRRRECNGCGYRFTTYESPENAVAKLAAVEKCLGPAFEILKGAA